MCLHHAVLKNTFDHLLAGFENQRLKCCIGGCGDKRLGACVVIKDPFDNNKVEDGPYRKPVICVECFCGLLLAKKGNWRTIAGHEIVATSVLDLEYAYLHLSPPSLGHLYVIDALQRIRRDAGIALPQEEEDPQS